MVSIILWFIIFILIKELILNIIDRILVIINLLFVGLDHGDVFVVILKIHKLSGGISKLTMFIRFLS